MPKSSKPPLSLVPPSATSPPPPPGLGAAGLRLWRSIQGEVMIDDAGGLTLLLQMAEAADRAAALAAAVAADGATFKSRGGTIRVHPAVAGELALRGFISRGLSKLGLLDEPVGPVGRPPGGWRG
jgi:hypothetical protein